MNAPLHRRLILVSAIILAANPATWATNPPGSTLSRKCNECGNQCSTCGTSLGSTGTAALASFDWEIQVGLARYSKPTTYTDLAQAAYEKDGNLPTFNEMLGRYFPSSPLQQSQIPLKISQTRISAATFHPSCLALESEANIPEVLKMQDAGGEFIHQILTDDGFTLINILPSNDGSGFRVRVWKRNAAPLAKDGNNEFYVTAGPGNFESKTALTDVIFKRETPTNDNTLLYIQNETTGSGTRTITNKIVQTLGINGKPSNVTSEVFAGDVATGTPLSREILDYSNYGDRAWDYTITRQVLTSTLTPPQVIGNPPAIGTPVPTSESVEVYRDFSNPVITNGGELGMKRLMSISQSGQLTTYAYIEDDTEDSIRYGRLASVTRPDGSSTAYTYLSMGSSPVITEYSSWCDEPGISNGVPNTNARKTETTVSGNTFTVRTFVGNSLIAKSETKLTTLSGSPTLTLVTTRQWDGSGTEADPSLTETSSNNLATITAYHLDTAAAPDTGRIAWIEHPDGTATTYSYGNPPTGSLLIATFACTTRAGACTIADNIITITDGTETVTTYSLGNIPIAESKSDIATSVDLESWVTEPAVFDPIGRPITRVYNSNEDDFDSSTYSCCGLETFRARDGSTTHYYRDPLKRVHTATTTADSATNCPVVATLTTISGLTTTQVRKIGSSTLFLGSTTRSLDGLTTTSVSPSRKSTVLADRLTTTTTTEHDPAHLTGDTVTVAAPEGSTTTTNYLDGRPHTVVGDVVTGDARTNVTYTYAANAAHGGFTTTATAPFSEETEQITETHTDALGRTVQTVSPASGTTTYTYHESNAGVGASGKLASITDDDDVTTTYGYNTKGERETASVTIPAVDDDETAVTATRTTTTSSGVTDHEILGDCRYQSQSISSGWGTSGVSGPFLISGTYTSIDGLSSVTETPAGATVTVTTRPDGSGVAISTTTHPDGTRTVTTITHGLTTKVENQNSSNAHGSVSWTTYEYDSLQRLQYVTDSRTDTDGRTAYSVFTESGTPLVTTKSGRVTTNTCDSLGRVIESILPDNTENHSSVTHTSYYPSGRVKAQWGSQAYPTFRVYNGQGQLAELHTWKSAPTLSQGTASPPGSSTKTEWLYYPTTGLLKKKTYADGQDAETDRDPGPEYTYTAAGRLATRTWARGGMTTYGHIHGFLTGAAHSDGTTPDIAITYDTLGRKHSESNGLATSIYTYADGAGGDHEIDTETITYAIPEQSAFSRTLDRANRSFGRDTGWDLKEFDDDGNLIQTDNTASYNYDTTTGRINTISGVSSVSFTYGYAASSNLVETITKNGAGGSPVLKATNTYEDHRDVLLTKSNTKTISSVESSVSSITYTVNDIGQRTNAARTRDGAAAHSTIWGYDTHGQLASSDDSIATFDRGYLFDTIGNRLAAETAGPAVPLDENGQIDPDAGTGLYESNALNQYTTIPLAPATPTYDLDGNMTTGPLPASPGATSTLVWDAENRLVEVKDDQENTLVAHAYDALSRLIATTTPDGTTLFLYDGWNRIAEYNVTTVTEPTPATTYTLAKTYLWGLDLSGSMQGAGGVSGLLAVSQDGGTYYPAYDGNGNVTEYLDALADADTETEGAQPAANVVAHYEYDPFGNDVTPEGSKGAKHDHFAHRFSTKPLDVTTGFYYYGKRYYDSLTGRWPSRDPIAERGGVNLYGFASNDGINRWDLLGLNTVTLTLTRNRKGWFAIYGDLRVTADDEATAKCCGFPLSYKTLESPGVSLKPEGRYTPTFVPENSDPDGDGNTSLNGKYNYGLNHGYWTQSDASIPGRPSGMSETDYNYVINAELHSSEDSGLNIHFGPNTNHSTGCVLIGHNYVFTYQTLTSGFSDRFDSSLQRDVPYLVPAFDLQDSINSEFELFKAIRCAKNRGARLSYVVANKAPTRDPNIPHPTPAAVNRPGQVPRATVVNDIPITP